MDEKKKMLDDFIELATTDAASGQERAVADKLIGKLEEMGFSVTMDEAGASFGGNCGNLLAIREGEGSGALLFSSHMDRVPNGFSIHPVERDGYLCSDGTTILAADDLSGVCAILSGVRQAIAAGEKLPRIEILFTVGEEAGLKGAKAADLSKLRSHIGYVFDSPGKTGRFINAAPSYYKLKTTFHGKASHAGSSPEKGLDAAKAMALALSRLDTGRIDDETTANFPVLRTGTAVTNIVCDHAQMEGEVRSHNTEKARAYAQHFEAVCRRAAAETGTQAVLAISREMESFFVHEEEPVLQGAREACKALGIPCTIEGAGGGMDANIFNAFGIATIGVATGYGKNHTTEEQLNLTDFYLAGELAKTLILQYQEESVKTV